MRLKDLKVDKEYYMQTEGIVTIVAVISPFIYIGGIEDERYDFQSDKSVKFMLNEDRQDIDFLGLTELI